MAEGSHNKEKTDFYGSLKEIIELQYSSDREVNRTVVLFRCEWYDLGSKKTGLRDDGYFKSIYTGNTWYKTDPFILSTQGTKVFYLQDTKFGKNWQVVQKFEHRHCFDLSETGTNGPNGDVGAYQSEESFGVELHVDDNEPLSQPLHREDQDGCFVNASVVNNMLKEHDDLPHDTDSCSEDNDDTWLQYCTQNDASIGTDESEEDYFSMCLSCELCYLYRF